MADNKKIDITIKQALNNQAQAQAQASNNQQTAGLKSPISNQQKQQKNLSSILKQLTTGFASLKSTIQKNNKDAKSTLDKLNKNIQTLNSQQKSENNELASLNKTANTISQKINSKQPINTFNQKEFSQLLTKYFQDINSKLLQIHTQIYQKFSNQTENTTNSNLEEAILTLQTELSSKLQEIIDKDNNTELISKLQQLIANNNQSNSLDQLNSITQSLSVINQTLNNQTANQEILKLLNDINQNINSSSEKQPLSKQDLDESISKIISTLQENSNTEDKIIDISNIENALNNFLNQLKTENTELLQNISNNQIQLTAAPQISETNTFDYQTLNNINTNISNTTAAINNLNTPLQTIQQNTITIQEAIKQLNNQEKQENAITAEIKQQQIKVEINSIIDKEKQKQQIQKSQNQQIQNIYATQQIDYQQLFADIQKIQQQTNNISDNQDSIASSTQNIEENISKDKEQTQENIQQTKQQPIQAKTSHLLTINKISSQSQPTQLTQNITETTQQQEKTEQPINKEQNIVDLSPLMQSIISNTSDILNTNIEKYSDINSNLLTITELLSKNNEKEKEPVLITITGTNTEILSSKQQTSKQINNVITSEKSTIQKNTQSKTIQQKTQSKQTIQQQNPIQKKPQQITHKIEIFINGLNTNIITSGDKSSSTNITTTAINPTQTTNSTTQSTQNNQQTIAPTAINGVSRQEQQTNNTQKKQSNVELLQINRDNLKQQSFDYIDTKLQIQQNNNDIKNSNVKLDDIFEKENISILENQEFKEKCKSNNINDINEAIKMIKESFSQAQPIQQKILNEILLSLQLKIKQLNKKAELDKKQKQLENQIAATQQQITTVKSTMAKQKQQIQPNTSIQQKEEKKSLDFLDIMGQMDGMDYKNPIKISLGQKNVVKTPEFDDTSKKSKEQLKKEALEKFTSLKTDNELIDKYANAYMKGRFTYVYQKYPEMSDQQIKIIGNQMITQFNDAWNKGYILIPNKDGSEFAKVSKEDALNNEENTEINNLQDFIEQPEIVNQTTTDQNNTENIDIDISDEETQQQPTTLQNQQSQSQNNIQKQSQEEQPEQKIQSTNKSTVQNKNQNIEIQTQLEQTEQQKQTETPKSQFQQPDNQSQEQSQQPEQKQSITPQTIITQKQSQSNIQSQLQQANSQKQQKEQLQVQTKTTNISLKNNIQKKQQQIESQEEEKEQEEQPNKPTEVNTTSKPETFQQPPGNQQENYENQFDQVKNSEENLPEKTNITTTQQPQKKIQTQGSDNFIKKQPESKIVSETKKSMQQFTSNAAGLFGGVDFGNFIDFGAVGSSLEQLQQAENALMPKMIKTTQPKQIQQQKTYYKKQQQNNTTFTQQQKNNISQELASNKENANPIGSVKSSTLQETTSQNNIVKKADDFSKKPESKMVSTTKESMKQFTSNAAGLFGGVDLSEIVDFGQVGEGLEMLKQGEDAIKPKMMESTTQPEITKKSTKPATQGATAVADLKKATQDSKKQKQKKEQANADQLNKSVNGVTTAITNNNVTNNQSNNVSNNEELLAGINNLVQASKPQVIYIFADEQNATPKVKTFVNIG